ncbi:hypothetical protein GOV06_02820 [Candidatus Woesearchaeota archaeon]|nr:hypothetical protein [Candidatus Woesearchaeota archaeon]
MFLTVKPQEGKGLENAINVSSHGTKPYNRFSPFTYSTDILIPVPEQDDIYANSVESIWQGLKLIDKQVDFERFTKKPKKRRGNVQGHMYGKNILDIVSAREQIYKPSYLFYVENFVPSEIKEDVLAKALEHEVAFYDVESNINIKDISAPLAHSVFLKMFFDDYLGRRLEDVRTNIDGEYQKQEFKHETLAEPLARALRLYADSSEVDKMLMEHLLAKEHDLDKFHKRYYSNLLEKINSL